MKIKKDKYLRKRGGSAKITDVKCALCKTLIFTYQKDGPGWLKRCYINRIIENPERNYEREKDMPQLKCACGNHIGIPMTHKDGRLAYRLIRGSFTRRNKKHP